MKNKITDLNNHLFAALERLSDEDITPEQLDTEIERSKSIAGIAKIVVASAKVSVSAMALMERAGYDITTMAQPLLGLDKPKL